MNKTELIEKVAKKTQTTKTLVSTIVNACMDTITKEVRNNSKVNLVGWGCFYAVSRPQTDGVNPRTKEKIKVPACIQPKFRAGKDFKQKVNKK